MAQQVADYELYKRIKLLGEGAFGKAFLAECVSDSSLCVIKQVDLSKMTDQEKKDTLREAKILESFDHPNIVKFKEVYKTKKGKLCIVMDYADGGDLAGRIKNQKGTSFPETQILDWFTQICLALKHVHDRKIIHRDLKGQNIFLTKTNLVKLGDFGIARVLSSTRENAKTMVGTPYYLSPEIINGKAYSFKSDIWSLGVVLYELCALKPPFDAQSLTFLAMKIIKGQYSPVPGQFSRELKNLVGTLLQVDPLKRPSVNEVLKFPVIQGRIQNFLSKSVKLQEFSHTILHKQQFVKNNMKFDEIKSVNNEAPIPQHLLKQKSQPEDKNAQKPPLPKPIYQPAPTKPTPNLFSPPNKEESKPKNDSPPNKHNIPQSYLPQNNNLPAGKPNYHYKNNPSPEPYKGPKIVEVSKDQNPYPKNDVKGIQEQVKNIEDKVNHWMKNDPSQNKPQQKVNDNKYVPSQIPSREQQRPSNPISDQNKARGGNNNRPQVNGNPFDPIVRQQNQQKQENRVEAPKKVDREILGGGGGGMAFNFAPSSNKNANAKKDLFVGNSKKKPAVPVNQTPKRAEIEKREKEQAQQKLAEMKRKAEEEIARKEKRAVEEAEKKQIIQIQRMEREKEREEARRKIREDRERLRGAIKRGMQVEIYDIRGKSMSDLQDEEEKTDPEGNVLNDVIVDREKEGGRSDKKEDKKLTRGFSLADKINKKLGNELRDTEEETETQPSKPQKRQMKRGFTKQKVNKDDPFNVEIFVPGKKDPLNMAEVNQEQPIYSSLIEEQKVSQDQDPSTSADTRAKDYETPSDELRLEKHISIESDTGRIIESLPDLNEEGEEKEEKEDGFIDKLEQSIKFYDENGLLDPKYLEKLQDITRFIDECNNATQDNEENQTEQVEDKQVLENEVEQEDREDDDPDNIEPSPREEVIDTPGNKVEEEAMKVMMDYSKLECLKVQLENILGIDTFLNAYKITKDLLRQYTLDELEVKYGRKDNYASLFPFMSEEALKEDLKYVFTYVVCEEEAEKNHF